MSKLPLCPKCSSDYTYQEDQLFICPDCGYEWSNENVDQKMTQEVVVKDAFGNLLQDGDSVTIIKDLKVKGASSALKVGIKVKNIKIVDEVNGHNIEAKVPGFGVMMLKSEIVKKSN